MEDNLIEWTKSFSYDTWLRLGYSRRVEGIFTSEVTLTQNLIYGYYCLSREFNLPIQVFEAKDEKNNGNDLEIAIELKEGYVLLPTQAKVLKKSERYEYFNHKSKSKNKFQFDLLDEYSQNIRGVPLYLFYNMVEMTLNERGDALSKEIDFDYHFYGCSIALLSLLRQCFYKGDKIVIPSFWDIHPKLAYPLFQLIEYIGKPYRACKLFTNMNRSIQFYSEDEVTNEKFWRNIAPRPSIGRIPKKKVEIVSLYDENKYQPRFRIVLSGNTNFNKFSIVRIGF